MADLFIDGDALAATRTTLENIRETLAGAASSMGTVPGDVTANESLRSRLSSFGEEWRHGIDRLAEVSGGGADGLTMIAEGFARVDAELAAALETDEGTGPGPEAV